MLTDPWQWGLLLLAAFSIGLSKAGFSGISLISVFILTEMFGAKAQVGVALPMLVIADLIVFPAFRKYGNWREVWILLWPTVIGGAIATYILMVGDNESMRPVIGWIIFSMVLMQLLRKWKADFVYKLAITKSFGIFAGLAGGVATVLANAAGPINQMYLLSKRLDKMDLIGVGARFFLIVNMLKLPLNGGLGLMNSSTLTMNAIAIPAIVAGVLGGKYLLKLIPQKVFEALIIIFALIASVRLLCFA